MYTHTHTQVQKCQSHYNTMASLLAQLRPRPSPVHMWCTKHWRMHLCHLVRVSKLSRFGNNKLLTCKPLRIYLRWNYHLSENHHREKKHVCFSMYQYDKVLCFKYLTRELMLALACFRSCINCTRLTLTRLIEVSKYSNTHIFKLWLATLLTEKVSSKQTCYLQIAPNYQ